MPRFEARLTSDNTLRTFEASYPVDPMNYLPPGNHRPRVMSEEQATDLVVPALTAGTITQAGSVLSVVGSNAPSLAEFNWQSRATAGDAWGNATGTRNGETYDRGVQTGQFRRGVRIPGVQDWVYTPEVTIGGIPAPAYVTGARINQTGTNLVWNSAAGFLPAGQHIVYLSHTGANGNVTFTLTGTNLTAVSPRLGNLSASYKISAWLVTVGSGGSAITITGPATTETMNQVDVFSTGGLTDTSAIFANSNVDVNPVTVTRTGVPANHHVFAFARGRQGTTTALAWGGGFAAGDLIATRDQSSSPPAAWISGDFVSLAYKARPAAGDFAATLTPTDDGTRNTTILVIAFPEAA